jgi:hypothetical protein
MHPIRYLWIIYNYFTHTSNGVFPVYITKDNFSFFNSKRWYILKKVLPPATIINKSDFFDNWKSDVFDPYYEPNTSFF